MTDKVKTLVHTSFVILGVIGFVILFGLLSIGKGTNSFPGATGGDFSYVLTEVLGKPEELQAKIDEASEEWQVLEGRKAELTRSLEALDEELSRTSLRMQSLGEENAYRRRILKLLQGNPFVPEEETM